VRFVVLVLLVAACGDNSSPCDHRETDDVADGSAAETTGLTFGGGAQTVCGSVEGGHYDTAEKIVDVDRYRVAVGGTGELSVDLQPLDGADVLASLSVRLFDTAKNPRLYADQRWDKAYDHAAFDTEVPPGDYDLVVVAGAAGDIMGGTIDYRVRVTADPSKQCGALTHATYSERDDAGNDPLVVDYATPHMITAGNGTAEATGVTLSPGHHYMFGGVAAPAAMKGDYTDGDGFAVTTADDTDELTVRLDWDAQVDLDYLVVEADTLTPAALSVITGTSEHELATFAVKPNTRYLAWVGAFKGWTGSVPYGLTVCADHHVP
jgi:hypothetical protein